MEGKSFGVNVNAAQLLGAGLTAHGAGSRAGGEQRQKKRSGKPARLGGQFIHDGLDTLCLRALQGGGQIALKDRKWLVREVGTVDTHQDPDAGQRLKAWWTRVGLERLEHEAPGQFSYNLCTVSQADYQRIRELHLAYFREIRSIVAQSEPCQRVVLINMQVMPLDEDE